MSSKKQVQSQNPRSEHFRAAMQPVKNGNMRTLRYLPYVLLGMLLLLIVVIRYQFLNTPFERDEGDYFYLAQRLLDGKIPYHDFYEQKLPGIFYAYALMITLFGATVKGAHIGFLVINLLTICLIFFIGKKLFNSYAGFMSAASFAFLSLVPHISGFTTQSEHLVIFYATMGFLLLIDGLQHANRKYQFILSGLLIGFSVLIKQSAVFLALLGGCSIVIFYLFQKPVPWRKLLANSLLFVAGGTAIGCIFLFIIYRYGTMAEMWYWTFDFAKNYSTEFPFNEGIKLLRSTLSRATEHYLIFWLSALAGLLLILFTRKSFSFKIIIWLSAVLSIMTILPGLRFYGHYWIQLTPILAVLAGSAFYSSEELLGKFFKIKTPALALLTLFLFMMIVHISVQSGYYFNPQKTKLLREVYGMNPFPESKVIADYIKSRTQEGDQIAVLGSEPQIYFYTNRRCVSRHHYLTFLMGDSLKFPNNRIYQQEFISDVETKKPKFIVFVRHSISWLMNPRSDQTIQKWFTNFVNREYKIVGIADMISPQQTEYVWDAEAATYSPKSEYFLAIFEVKTTNP